jgi:virulence factor Mce-like protein
MELRIDRDVDIPAEAGAVIVAQSLVDSRYVQLTPAYRGDGETMPDGAVIPLERTAVPVEWDEIKTQLTRLATELGPDGDEASGPAGRFIDSAADALAGNGDKLRQVLAQLSGVGRILATGSGDIADTIKNLQIFVTALRDSNVQIVQFQNRLATLTSVLDSSRSDLDAALNNLAVAVGEVQRFVSENRDKASEQVGRLADVTQNLVDNRGELEELLHIFPTSLANFYNIYNPDTGTEAGVFVLNNFSNPIEFVCGGIASVENIGAEEAARKCRDYLGPVLGLMNFNYLPVPVNPALGPSPATDNIIYSEPDLVPAAAAVDPAAPPPPPAPTLADILFPGGR